MEQYKKVGRNILHPNQYAIAILLGLGESSPHRNYSIKSKIRENSNNAEYINTTSIKRRGLFGKKLLEISRQNLYDKNLVGVLKIDHDCKFISREKLEEIIEKEETKPIGSTVLISYV